MAAHSRPQPLLTRAGLVSTIGVLVSLLVGVGVVPATLGKQITTTADVVITAVFAVIALAGPLVHALVSRSAVTPVADPRDNSGARLVPAGSTPATLDAADALAAADAIHPADDPVAPDAQVVAG